MIDLSRIVEELSAVMERQAAEKVAQVVASAYEQMHESIVLRRLEAVEDSVRLWGEEMRHAIEQLARQIEAQIAAHRLETDERFRELAEAQRRTEQRLEELAQFQQRAYQEFQEYRKQTDERFLELREEQRRMYAEFQEYRKQTDERFRELAEAQRRTEQRLEELAQFQQRAYREFQEYRKQTDERFRELAEAQRRTEQRLEELAQFQQRAYQEFQEYRKQTDERFRELAEAQRRTEERVAALAQAMLQMRQEFKAEIQEIRRQLGGLSQTMGYTLENEAMKRLPDLLQGVGIRVEGRLKRGYVRDSEGRFIEVNIFGTGYRNGEQVTLVGESKAQLSRNDVDRFLHRTVESLQGVYPNIVPLLVTHIASAPDVEDYARSLGVLVYYSYEF